MVIEPTTSSRATIRTHRFVVVRGGSETRVFRRFFSNRPFADVRPGCRQNCRQSSSRSASRRRSVVGHTASCGSERSLLGRDSLLAQDSWSTLKVFLSAVRGRRGYLGWYEIGRASCRERV